MQHNTIIQWNTAIQQAQKAQEERTQEKAHYLQEFKDNDLSMLDARDIHFFSEMTGIEANELRRMHPQKDTEILINSFIGDETDDIMDFF
jgi:hypothetical protein